MPQYHADLKTWIAPLAEKELTLKEAYDSLTKIGNHSFEVPLLIQLVENPKFHFKGLGWFKGRVTLEVHDYIHIALGRGLMPNDEAFVIGFTMGSTNRVSTHEKALFSFIAGKIYPGPYKFTKIGAQIFKDAVHLGYVSDCQPLDKVDWDPLISLPLKEVRREIGLECDLLQAYYDIAAKRYPKCSVCQRIASSSS
ncbi:MAG: hypothetical protein AAF558_14385 [Verrucomicrobiota bacterium]